MCLVIVVECQRQLCQFTSINIKVDGRKIVCKRYVTSVVQGRADVDVRTLGLFYVGYCCLDCVEGANLNELELSQFFRKCFLEVNLTVSISRTVLNAFSESPEIGARKFPAAPGDRGEES